MGDIDIINNNNEESAYSPKKSQPQPLPENFSSPKISLDIDVKDIAF